MRQETMTHIWQTLLLLNNAPCVPGTHSLLTQIKTRPHVDTNEVRIWLTRRDHRVHSFVICRYAGGKHARILIVTFTWQVNIQT